MCDSPSLEMNRYYVPENVRCLAASGQERSLDDLMEAEKHQTSGWKVLRGCDAHHYPRRLFVSWASSGTQTSSVNLVVARKATLVGSC